MIGFAIAVHPLLQWQRGSDATRQVGGRARYGRKAVGRAGKKIRPDERDAQTQDFVMINHPVFFANDPKRYFWLEWVQKTIPTWMKKFPLVPTPSVENPLLLAEYSERLVTLLAVAVPLGIKGAKLFWEVTGSKIVSPLTASYWSMSAYRLGNPPHKMAVRFSVTPRQNQPPKFIADTSSRNYLRETMKSSAREGRMAVRFQTTAQAR